MGRRKARQGLMQLLYQMDLNSDFSQNVIDLSLENNDWKVDEAEFIKESAEEMVSRLEEIDKIISDNLKGWTFERIAMVDKQILRIAVYEMLKGQIPNKIIINEAIEIAKKYSTVDAPKFINGILGTIYRKSTKEI